MAIHFKANYQSQQLLYEDIETRGNAALLEKYPTFFCENLVDLNEARLHGATMYLHTHA